MLVCWRKILRILEGCTGPGVAVPPSGRVQVDAGQERGELGGGHLDAPGRGERDAEGAALEPLGPDGQAIAVPVEERDAIPAVVVEDEELRGVGGDWVRGGGLRGGWLVEVFPEGMDGDAASLAEFGLSQAAPAEILEEGVPAEVEDAAPRHGVNSRTGRLAPSRE